MTSKEAMAVLTDLKDKDYEIWLSADEKTAIIVALTALEELHGLAESWYCVDEEGS